MKVGRPNKEKARTYDDFYARLDAMALYSVMTIPIADAPAAGTIGKRSRLNGFKCRVTYVPDRVIILRYS